ncbi:hypothetical protein FS749_012149 [Ceratobasidium sp. UAMH 11750]|nr:hypothetical protein FS749_012149 [Ceratobasidium sp. UAMH 11750]
MAWRLPPSAFQPCITVACGVALSAAQTLRRLSKVINNSHRKNMSDCPRVAATLVGVCYVIHIGLHQMAKLSVPRPRALHNHRPFFQTPLIRLMSHRSCAESRSFQPQQGNPCPSKLFEGLSTQDLCTIPIPPTLHSAENNDVEITNVVTLGSYNWVEHPTPLIIVPGYPPVWKEPTLPLQLDPDSGPAFIDQNAARSPNSPLEPMIRAISVIQGTPNSNLTLSNENIDIVTDRNNLRKLMRFICSNGPNRHRNREFRIDAQLAPNDKTLVLTRYDKHSVDNSTDFRGYGHNFEAAVTSEPLPLEAMSHISTAVSRLKITSYHRIIRYDFLGLRFMVRFEVDAMTNLIKDDKPQNDADTLAEVPAHPSPPELCATPPGAAIRTPSKQVETVIVEGSGLRHAVHGMIIPQSSLVELKTIKSKLNVKWSDVYPQLFLAQTPTAKVAKHVNGLVGVVQTYNNASEELQKAHADLSRDFRALVILLTQMRAVSARYRSLKKPLSFYWTGGGDLRVRTIEYRDNLLSAKELAIF